MTAPKFDPRIPPRPRRDKGDGQQRGAEGVKKLIKRRVVLLLPVVFTAESERGLKEAMKNYREDPCHSSFGFGEHGFFRWKQETPRRRHLRSRADNQEKP